MLGLVNTRRKQAHLRSFDTQPYRCTMMVDQRWKLSLQGSLSMFQAHLHLSIVLTHTAWMNTKRTDVEDIHLQGRSALQCTVGTHH